MNKQLTIVALLLLSTVLIGCSASSPAMPSEGIVLDALEPGSDIAVLEEELEANFVESSEELEIGSMI